MSLKKLLLLPLFVSASLCVADDVVIESFDGNGTITWDHASSSGVDRVEWASSPTGSWQRSWQSLVNLAVTSGPTTVEVPMFYRVVHSPVTMVTGELTGISSGSNSYHVGRLANGGVLSNTVSMTSAGYTFSDPDHDGFLGGDPGGNGILIAATGAWLLNFSAGIPPAGTAIEAAYSYVTPPVGIARDEVIETGDGASTVYTGTLGRSNAVAGSLSITIGSFFLHDLDQDGNLDSAQGGGAGTIDYATGAWSLDLVTSGADLTAEFKATYQYLE